nr:hypothetical protein [Gemmatimonadota bacterium]
LGNAYAWSGDRSLVERHWDSMRRVLDWARTEGDLDGDGIVTNGGRWQVEAPLYPEPRDA